MSGDEDHPFKPGTAVIVQVGATHYGPGSFRRDEVIKLHKTGHFTLKSDPGERFKPYRSGWGDGEREWIGFLKTRGYSIYSTQARVVSPASEKEMADGIEDGAHKERCRDLERAFGNPKKIPAAVSRAVSEMLAAIPKPPTP